ncbi:MAG: SDR family oxidoreductase [Leptospirales bacterium]|nr:SDR family oxidoreductase [Leptospirales bacterium]
MATARKKRTTEGEGPALDSMSLDALRSYVAERERRESGAATLDGGPHFSGSEAAKSLRGAAMSAAAGAFSVRQTLDGKKIMMIGGTGFLGRVMLYMLLKYSPVMERIYVLIRPTHGRTGQDRLEKEILESPVFTTVEGDREYFRRLAAEKITVVEGDAARTGMNLKPEVRELLLAEVDVVLNTAGNVEFNPPLDLSLNANAIATREVLDFVEATQSRRYVHISTCYVADRQRYPDRAPEVVVSDRVVNASGNEIVIDAERELAEAARVAARLKENFERPEKMDEFRAQAWQELKRFGREDVSDRLAEKTAKNLRTMALREELIRAGRERAERLNRPNVYTYTKTLAELIVKAREDRIRYTIVRPSIVETAIKYPFAGWNEGIQGSAPLMYLIYKGHRMLPSISTAPGERQEARLDIIQVDLVAAGTILAMAALLADEHKPVYQLAAGGIDTPVTPNRLLNVLQVKLRAMNDPALPRYQRFMHRHLETYPVTKKQFQKFSSPRMLKILSRARDSLERLEARKLPGLAHEMVQRVQGNVERYYQLSHVKNRIFGEFMPFMNHGFPIFENQNCVDLWRRLPPEESEIYFFNPYQIDFIDYLANYHMDSVFKWIFPVLDKRFKSIDQIGRKSPDKSEGANSIASLRAVFASSDMDFSDRVHLLRRAAAQRLKTAREKRKAARAARQQEEELVSSAWIRQHVRHFTDGVAVNQYSEMSPEARDRFAAHVSLIGGIDVDGKGLLDMGAPAKLERLLDRRQEELAESSEGGLFSLPEDGVEIPDFIREPTAEMLYRLQMWFYRRVVRARVAGRDNIPLNNNNVILVANHASHLDYGLVWYSLGDYARDMGILAARDYFFDRFLKSTFFGNFLNLIPVERADNSSYGKALKHGLEFLQKGGPLLIFPEGTRSPDGKMRTFRHGLGYLVQHARADVLPLRLYNTHVALPKGKTLVRRADVRVQIGKLVSYEELEEQTRGFSPTKTYAHIARSLEEAVRSIHGKAQSDDDIGSQGES